VAALIVPLLFARVPAGSSVSAMTSSGTYTWQPPIGDLILSAFSRINLRGPELTTQHLADAATECNLLSVSFSNRNPNQYALETVTVPLVQGTATYALPNRTLAIGIAYLSTASGDRPLGPISATDYGAISNKTTQGPPTSIWFLLTPTPSITVWPTPDNSYTLNIQSFRQQQDVGIANGETPDVPYRFLEAFTAGLAARFARIYAPALYPMRKQDYEEAFQEAAQADQASVNLYIVPGLSRYVS
jgi:hypothetical protein